MEVDHGERGIINGPVMEHHGHHALYARPLLRTIEEENAGSKSEQSGRHFTYALPPLWIVTDAPIVAWREAERERERDRERDRERERERESARDSEWLEQVD